MTKAEDPSSTVENPRRLWSSIWLCLFPVFTLREWVLTTLAISQHGLLVTVCITGKVIHHTLYLLSCGARLCYGQSVRYSSDLCQRSKLPFSGLIFNPLIAH